MDCTRRTLGTSGPAVLPPEVAELSPIGQPASSIISNPVEIVTTKLVSTTIGSLVRFEVAFRNIGTFPIYYASPNGGTTSPVYAFVLPCSPSPLTSYSTTMDCFYTISTIPLLPGQTASAKTSYCTSSANYEIASHGMIQAAVTVNWSPNASDVLSGHTDATYGSQDFSVG